MKYVTYLGPILLAIATNASANPGGGEVVAGKATINKHDSLLEIRQQTDRAVIEWKKFDIASHEHTKFVQPSKDSVVLNRVKSDRASEIMGKLTANGKVVIVNPNGIRFGKDAKVDVNGLIASASDIANNKFMEGGSKLEFDKPGNADAAIINEGRITAAEAGLVGLVAPSVMNSGIIEAKLGKVELASGDVFAVDLYGNNLLQLELSDKVKAQIIASSGTIEAGKIAITAAAAKELVDSLVVIAGELKAPVAKEEGGVIKISGGETVIVAGKLDASNRKSVRKEETKQSPKDVELAYGSNMLGADGTEGRSVLGVHEDLSTGATQQITPEELHKGGKIEVTGKHITLLDSAELDVSGQHGGGDIKVGGDYLGQGNTPTAETTYVAQGATIYNDAIASGDGGRTIIWSDDTTEFHGSIYGRGGAEGGDGGFVETSGKQNLIADGHVDLTSPQGAKGTYLLDPDSIAIYGNVDPLFVSTDSTVDLSDGLRLWVDAADRSTIMLTYGTNTLSGATVDRTSANTLETTTDVDVTGALAVGSRVRIGAAGVPAYADTLGADTFTISGLVYDGSKTIITTAETIPTAYAAQPLYRGLVSRWEDKSGGGRNASSSGNRMPLWVGGAQNGEDVIYFDGSRIFNLPDATLPTGNSNYTLHSVVKGSSGSSYRTILHAGSSIHYPASTHNFRLNSLFFYNNTHLSNSWRDTANTRDPLRLSSSPSFDDIIITVTYDNTIGRKGYINAEQTASNNNTTRNGLAPYNRIGGQDHSGPTFRFIGNMYEILVSDTPLSDAARNLLEQYQATKWDIGLVPPGTGADEAAKAMASDGYSVFASEYLEKLSQTADIALQATNDITLDLQGDTLTLANDQNISLTSTAGNIVTLSDGTIVANRTGVGGNISFSAAGDINIDHNLSLDAQNGGAISLTAAGDVAIGATGILNLNDADTTIRASGLTNAGTLTASGTTNFTFEQYNLANSLDVGDGGTGDVVVSDTIATTIKSNFANYTFGRSNGGDVTNYTATWDGDLTFLTGNDFTNALATTSDSAIFVNAGRDVVLLDAIETTSASADALTLVAGRNLVNNAGASALTANNSRWLVYSANVNNSTNASILNWDFRRYGCSYSGGCTSGITVPASENGLIYSTRPSLSIGAVVEAKQVDGNANATLSNVVLNGVIAGDTVTLGPITAKFADNSLGKHKPVYVTYSLTTGAELGYFLQNNGLYGEIYAPFIADSVRWFSQNAERYKRDVVEATARKSAAATSSPKLKDMLIIEPNLRSLLRIEDLF